MDARFDAVTACETVYFWPGMQESFREVRRVLKPGGAWPRPRLRRLRFPG